MIRIEVTNREVHTRHIKSNRTGREFTFHEQEAFAFVHDRNGDASKYPGRITLTLGDDQEPYEPGMYMLAPQSLYVDRFGKLTIGRVQLVKTGASAAKVA